MPHETRTPIVYSQLDAMAFMRQHGSAADVFQASSLDPGYVIAALSDCQPYYSHQMYWQRASEQVLVNARINQVWQFMALRDPAMIAMTAKKMGLRWFLLFTGQSVAWPASIVGKPAFEAEGFKLYQFD
jgi:hypothetical protein